MRVHGKRLVQISCAAGTHVAATRLGLYFVDLPFVMLCYMHAVTATPLQ